ncbi:arylsulfatase [Aquimarina sp. ERC-38]|uniref:sulfatase family protein n=1 Tax=Aquimarina sp. ERC-38 TaxID=2949996 RepID=UPI002246A86A|nr:arylsulfatase [Aquimarina sp. ERC-38]UZO82294.1 arylsulfatase [Aquimarina sp. ERC-38]
MKKGLLLMLSLGLMFGVFAQQKPNVIVILADDIGLGDVSYYREKHTKEVISKTPNIDRLAKEGIAFTNARTPAALCAPTRYAVMTGNHCYRSYAPWGVWRFYETSPIKTDQLTLGSLMKKAGYQTSFFGKWGFGMDFYEKGTTTVYKTSGKKVEKNIDVHQIAGKGPKENGFDYSLTFPSGIQNIPYVVYENEKWMPLKADSEIGFISQENMTKIGVVLDKSEGPGDTHWDPHNMGPLLVNKAVNYIKNSRKGDPFFMYYCSLAVHLPHTPTKSLNEIAIANTTPSRHLDMVKELDVQLGMLIDALKEKGIYDNTLLIFTSDNGGLSNKQSKASGHNSSDIYRGGKNKMYEGGNRVPLIVWWPGNVKPNSVSETPVLGIDIMATLAAITDQKIEGDNAMDSSSLLPILKGEDTLVHPFIMTQSGSGKQSIIIKDGFKLIMQHDKTDKTYRSRKPIALFNLNNNPTEKEKGNLIKNPSYTSKVQELFTLYNTTRNSGIKTRS